jgi:hypothetical protein
VTGHAEAPAPASAAAIRSSSSRQQQRQNEHQRQPDERQRPAPAAAAAAGRADSGRESRSSWVVVVTAAVVAGSRHGQPSSCNAVTVVTISSWSLSAVGRAIAQPHKGGRRGSATRAAPTANEGTEVTWVRTTPSPLAKIVLHQYCIEGTIVPAACVTHKTTASQPTTTTTRTQTCRLQSSAQIVQH